MRSTFTGKTLLTLPRTEGKIARERRVSLGGVGSCGVAIFSEFKASPAISGFFAFLHSSKKSPWLHKELIAGRDETLSQTQQHAQKVEHAATYNSSTRKTDV